MKKNYLYLGSIFIAILVGFIYWNGASDPIESLHPTTKFATWAFVLGALSAISLPLGAIAGLTLKPGARLNASMAAFGAGALLAALSVELIAPTVMEIVGQAESSVGETYERTHAFYTMGSLIIGCILGGFLFVTLDEVVNSKGGQLRKISTMINFLKFKKKTETIVKLESSPDMVIDAEIKKESGEHGGAPMAIWLGLLIDGIPESFVIGAGFLGLLSSKLTHNADPTFTSVIPFTLIAGLFLSNFPEALSSSIGMKKQGLSTFKIIMLWMSLVLIVAIGATVGYYLGAEIPHEMEIGVEGLAAGAMLTMIAQTMIPEAVHVGGNKVVGLSTLIGYLSAVAFKLLE